MHLAIVSFIVATGSYVSVEVGNHHNVGGSTASILFTEYSPFIRQLRGKLDIKFFIIDKPGHFIVEQVFPDNPQQSPSTVCIYHTPHYTTPTYTHGISAP
jgi:hypothetical protein